MADLPDRPFIFGLDDVEVTARETLTKGFFRLDAWTLRHRRFEGGWTPEFRRELFLRGDSTCILPFDPWTQSVVMLEQFRAGALERDRTPWLLELVAGMNEPGESPEEVAHREAREEADLEFLALERINRYLASPGGSTEMVNLYCGCVSVEGVGGIHGLDEEHEDIRVHVLAVDEALRMLRDGSIDNAASIIALQWLALNREELTQSWLELK